MPTTHTHPRGFLAELPQASLLFDYYTGDLPQADGEKPLFVFASHRHGDHFSEAIFHLPDRFKDVRYVISNDIWERRVPAEKRQKALFLAPGEERDIELSGKPEAAGISGQPETEPAAVSPVLRVHTFRSTDEGVAFLVDCGGTVIYHAGDLNNWTWKGEPDSWNHSMAANYHRELKKIREVLDGWGKEIDIAFVPLDGRLEENFYLGLDDFMRQVGAKRVFPMHCWDDYSVIGALKSMPESEPYRERIVRITGDGDSFEL